jgi:small-conductance mechanosensitive channel
MLTRFKGSLRTVAFIVALACLGLLSQGGGLATELLARFQTSDIAGLKDKLMPIGVNLLIGVLFLSISYLFYKPIKTALQAALDRAGASPRGKSMLMRSMQLGYWLIVVFVVASVVAPEILSKLFLGASILSAAIVLSLQGAAGDLLGGIFLNVTKRFQPGDNIEVIGMDKIKGKVVDIGYLSTIVKLADGEVTIPNKDIWSKPVKVVAESKPVSTIIMPPGYDPEREKQPSRFK